MHPLPQHAWIQRVRELAQADPRLVAALTYGSFTSGEGDRHSDIEFWLFVRDDETNRLDRRAWVSQVAPTLAVLDGLPHGLTLAVYAGQIRGEFHFAPASRMPEVRTWAANGPFPDPDAMLLLDRMGELRGHLQFIHDHPPRHGRLTEVQPLVDGFVNWSLQGRHLLRRGELARALNTLGTLHGHLLHLARLVEGCTDHWPTPSRGLERDLSPTAYARFVCCTAPLDPLALERAYSETWDWGREMIGTLRGRLDLQWDNTFDVAFIDL